MEIPIETISAVFEIASRGNVIKILNPAPLKFIPREILKNIDIIIPNEGELYRLHALLGFPEITNKSEQNLIDASKAIGTMGVNYIITTLGNNGCLIYDKINDKTIQIPAIKVNAIDTVGAGDCFNGVLASKLCSGVDILKAVKCSIAAASIAVTRKGAQESMPYKGEIELQYNKFKNHLG
jgi:ribokinase